MKRKKALKGVCHKKIKFNSKQEAEDKIEVLKKYKGITLYQYKCNVCDGWHLTKVESRKRMKKVVRKIQEKYNRDYNKEVEKEAEYWKEKNNW